MRKKFLWLEQLCLSSLHFHIDNDECSVLLYASQQKIRNNHHSEKFLFSFFGRLMRNNFDDNFYQKEKPNSGKWNFNLRQSEFEKNCANY